MLDSAKERLSWVKTAKTGMLLIFDDDIDSTFRIRSTVDPIRFILSISLRYPIAKEARKHVRAFIRTCAKEGDCEVPTIRITDRGIQAEILTKTRHRARDAKGKFVKQRFGGWT
jgi:hypothetical protein